MRIEGTIKSWNEERAFGFIEPTQGGQEIFVHLSAFPARSGRPNLHQRVSFEVGLNAEGKKRAKNVQLIKPARVVRQGRNRAAEWGGATLFLVPAFAILYLAVAFTWKVPSVIAAAYLAVSLLCFMAYAWDKSAATSGRWRTKESTLLLLGAFGGWPGGVLAQQFLRHKSTKASFRSAFWVTVWLNIAAFVGLSSPYGGSWNWLYAP